MEFIVEDFKLQPLQNGEYIKPAFATFKLNNQPRNWEVVDTKDSVAILLYNKDNDSFVCVRQFRPAVYASDKDSSGVTVELCAGLVDKNLTLEQIASEEIIEETGYSVDASLLTKITSFYTAVGSSGAKQHLYFAEVSNECKVSSGGGVEGEEMIDVVEICLKDAKEFMYNEDIAKTPGLLFAFEWFINKHS